ncbi:unnamed protein product [Sphagnum jensenii]|uniref:Solute carrier family 40 member n=1 Tax=Sphagnum jensenii TaxID=128206 RepID=A0ABP0W9F4_9BRYO
MLLLLLQQLRSVKIPLSLSLSLSLALMRMEVPGGDSPRTSPQDGDALRYDIEEEMVSGVEFRSSSGVLDSGVEPQRSGLNNVDTGTIIINRKEVDRLVRCLYGSHFLSRWGDRMWEFAVSLFMLHVWPNSLLLVAVYGLVEAASVAAFGVVIGELVDKFPRLKVVQIALGVQNGSIVVAAVATVILLLHPGAVLGGFGAFVTLVILVNTFGAFGALSGLAMDVVVERDWVVVIAEQAPGSLTRINSVMRRIDLSCKLLAPVAVGFLMSYASMLASAVLIAVWNVSSVGLEYGLLYIVYTAVPILQQKSPSRNTKLESPDAEELAINLEAKEIEMHSTAQEAQVQTEVGNLSTDECITLEGTLQHLPIIKGWLTYMRQEAMLAGLALALLYFTVLSFGSFMTAVLDWRGVPPYVLGLARAVAALVGILATVVYPSVHARLQTVRTGVWSIWLQCSLLSICVASTWVQSPRVASIMLIAGVAASRLGLWMFDLSVTQLMQESVPEAERGVVGGVQKSLQSLMDMLTYVVGLVISNPKDFGTSIRISFMVVFTAAALYTVHVYRVRGHLFHLDVLFLVEHPFFSYYMFIFT